MDDIRREIRRILLGYISFSENYIVAMPSRRLRLLGAFNGSSAARILGVAERCRRYQLSGKGDALPRECDGAFAGLGRRIQLESAPERQAVLFTPFWFNPSVLTAEMVGEDLIEVCVYTARTLSVGANSRFAFRRWRKQMPEELEEQSLPAEMKKHLFRRTKTEADANAGDAEREPLLARVKDRLHRKKDEEDD